MKVYGPLTRTRAAVATIATGVMVPVDAITKRISRTYSENRDSMQMRWVEKHSEELPMQELYNVLSRLEYNRLGFPRMPKHPNYNAMITMLLRLNNVFRGTVPMKGWTKEELDDIIQFFSVIKLNHWDQAAFDYTVKRRNEISQ